MKEFLKKNRFFVIIVIIFIALIIGLLTYTFFIKGQKNTTPAPNNEEIVTNEEAVISSFKGEFDTKKQQCNFSWTYRLNGQKANTITLWNKDSQLVDVSNYNSYSLPQSVFGLVSGENTFTLKLLLEDGNTVSSDVVVFIPIINSVKQDILTNDNNLSISLSYSYASGNEMEIPDIRTFGDGSAMFSVSYQNTEYEQKDNTTTAKTTFTFNSTLPKEEWKNFTLRWVFAQLGLNYDFEVDVNKV